MKNFFAFFCLAYLSHVLAKRTGKTNPLSTMSILHFTGPVIHDKFRTEGPISLDMGCHQALSEVVCTFEFTNNAKRDIHILTHNTPLEGLFSPFVTVLQEGHPVMYEGLFVYHTPPTKDDLVLLKAGRTVSASVEMTSAFSFDSDGLYTIQYSKPLEYLTAGGNRFLQSNRFKQMNQLSVSGSASVYLKNTHLLLQPTRLQTPLEESIGDIVNIESCSIKFIGGTSSQRSKITRAHSSICSYAQDVANGIANNDLYKTWFGQYTTTRANKVKSVYQKVKNGFNDFTLTYHMSGPNCKSDWAAYTQHGSKTVYICQYLHNIPTDCQDKSNPPDTQEAIVMHEWTHAFGLTNDHTYGVTNDQQLARNDPDKAIDNADSLERYYCPASYL